MCFICSLRVTALLECIKYLPSLGLFMPGPLQCSHCTLEISCIGTLFPRSHAVSHRHVTTGISNPLYNLTQNDELKETTDIIWHPLKRALLFPNHNKNSSLSEPEDRFHNIPHSHSNANGQPASKAGCFIGSICSTQKSENMLLRGQAHN